MQAWLGFGLLVVRVLIAGLPWERSVETPARFWIQFSRIFCRGLLINILAAVVASSFGIWTPVVDWGVWLIISATGWGIAVHQKKIQDGFFSRAVRMGLVLLLVGSAALFLPLRSEWLAGGWDPGIYQNNAVSIASHNGLAPRSTIYAQIDKEERTSFVRSTKQYQEIFPGLSLDAESGSFLYYFFHLTPVCGALFYRLGGMGLLTRLPMLIGFWLLIPFLGLLQLFKASRFKLIAGFAFLLTSPLWWYQQSVPTSEMLYIFLLLAGVLLYLDSVRGHSASITLWMLLFAAVLNHFNFPVVAVLMLLFGVTIERVADLPGRGKRLLVCYTALAAGMIWDLVYAAITIVRLQEKDEILQSIIPVVAVAMCMGLAIAWLPQWPVRKIRNLLLRFRMVPVLVALFGAFMVVILSVGAGRELVGQVADRLPFDTSSIDRMSRLISYQGWIRWIAVLLALVWMLFPSRKESGAWAAVSWIFALMTGVLVLHSGIAPLYPWALRRFLVVCFPLMMLTGSYLFFRIAQNWASSRMVMRVAGVIVLVAFITQGAVLSRKASELADYRGITTLLNELGKEIRPTDVVIADDQRWGTPVFMVLNADIINGRKLWRSKDPAYQQHFLQTMNRLRKESGRRFLWLTSSRARMNLYKVDVGEVRPVREDLSLTYPMAVHSSRGRSYEVEQKTKEFGLYEWTGMPNGDTN